MQSPPRGKVRKGEPGGDIKAGGQVVVEALSSDRSLRWAKVGFGEGCFSTGEHKSRPEPAGSRNRHPNAIG